MGITNLLKLVNFQETTFEDIYVEFCLEYDHKPVIGIDGYVLMHRYGLQEAEEIVKNPNYVPFKMIKSFMQFIGRLQLIGFDVFVVFDGKPMKIKKDTNDSRRGSRERAKQQEKWSQALTVTPTHAAYVIRELNKERIRYIVAPFEADPQLVYLQNIGIVDILYTVDSDVIAYGCSRAILSERNSKVKYYNSCICDDYILTIEEEKQVRKYETMPSVLTVHGSYDLNGLSIIQIQLLAVILGCDYFKGVYGVGYHKALPIVRKCSVVMKKDGRVNIVETIKKLDVWDDINKGIDKMIKNKKKTSGKSEQEILDDIVTQMRDAIRVFRYQPVYDIKEDKVLLFSQKEATTEEIDFFGSLADKAVLRDICYGKRDPNTEKEFNLFN